MQPASMMLSSKSVLHLSRGSHGQVCARVPKQGNINDLLEAEDSAIKLLINRGNVTISITIDHYPYGCSFQVVDQYVPIDQ